MLRGSGETFQVVGESALESPVAGANVFSTRIPVQAGDRFGAFEKGLLLCAGETGDIVAGTTGDVPSGSTFTANEAFPGAVRLPISAIVEPDADNDGYGDETQDGCPQDPGTHEACPQPIAAPSLDFFTINRRTSLVLLLSVSPDASVKVSGLIKLPIRKKAKRKARASKARIIGLRTRPQAVNPGQLSRFKLTLPGSVRRELRKLTPKQSLKATVTATATGATGLTGTKSVAIKLKGWKKKHKHRK